MEEPNPIVFLDITIAGIPSGRLKIELFKDSCPKTAENFRQFCTGEYKPNSVPIGYKSSGFHRIIKVKLLFFSPTPDFQSNLFQDFMIQGGDFVHSDGTGVQNIYTGSVFPDENFTLKHDSAGLLSMANSGKDTNGCQFFITCAKCNFLDNKHVVFGRVIDGLLIVRKIENVAIGSNNKPRLPITISQCGQM